MKKIFKKFKELVKAADIGNKVDWIFRRHGVKCIMLLFSIGLFTVDAVYYWGEIANNPLEIYFPKSLGMLALLLLFQVRGIIWEEAYMRDVFKLRDEVKMLQEFIEGTLPKPKPDDED